MLHGPREDAVVWDLLRRVEVVGEDQVEAVGQLVEAHSVQVAEVEVGDLEAALQVEVDVVEHPRNHADRQCGRESPPWRAHDQGTLGQPLRG